MSAQLALCERPKGGSEKQGRVFFTNSFIFHHLLIFHSKNINVIVQLDLENNPIWTCQCYNMTNAPVPSVKKEETATKFIHPFTHVKSDLSGKTLDKQMKDQEIETRLGQKPSKHHNVAIKSLPQR